MKATTLLALAATLAGAVSAHAQDRTIALVGGTVFPVSAPRIENGTVLIRGGRIVAVGRDVVIPADAERIEVRGRWITPGLFHPATDLGLSLFQTGGQEETRENLQTEEVHAAFAVVEGINPAAVTIPNTRIEGVTTAVTLPIGGLIAGQGAIIDLDGTTVAAMRVRTPAAMVVDLSETSKSAGGGSRAGAVQRLREVLRDARDFPARRRDFEQARIRPLAASAADLEALQPVLRGEVPVLAIANRRSDIENALGIAREFGLRLIVWSGAEAWQVADALAAAQVPVIVNSRHDIPSFDAPQPRLDNAALLRRAGVTVLLSDEEPRHSFNTAFRTLRQAAGEAVRNGMAWDDALAAVTLAPARAFGAVEGYGALEPGKVADVVVWSGDPFEFSSRAERIYIRGRAIPLESRMTRLLERYRTLPPTY